MSWESRVKVTIEVAGRIVLSGLMNVWGASSAVCMIEGLQNWTAPPYAVQ
jgi:hypothetical protein